MQFASKCRAGELLPGSRAAPLGDKSMLGLKTRRTCDTNQAGFFFSVLFRTMAAPGLYFVTSPILAIIGLFLFAAFMVYLVVPVAALAGLYFKRDKKKRDKLKIQAREAFDELPEERRHGLVWTDLQERQWPGTWAQHIPAESARVSKDFAFAVACVGPFCRFACCMAGAM